MKHFSSKIQIIQINATCGFGSTGRICESISDFLSKEGIDNLVLYSEGSSKYKKSLRFCSPFLLKIEALLSKIFGNYGFNGFFSTKILIKKIKRMNPKIVHLHNIHNHAINYTMLFSFLQKSNIKVLYTFHDCWSFTGYCTHFLYCGCNKWKKKCFSCPLKRNYSFFFDKSTHNYIKKKKATEDSNMIIVTPSIWLKETVSSSFLGNKKTIVINNGIDLSVFKPTTKSFKKQNIFANKYIVLGVSSIWNERKGIDVFETLSNELDERFVVVLVGKNIPKSLQSKKNVVSIEHINNQKELADIYSSADVFVNPTKEDTFPTVNLEAIACGTPVITNNIGGSFEMLNNDCGMIMQNTAQLISYLKSEKFKTDFSSKECVKHAEIFMDTKCFKKYLALYRSLL